MTKKLRARIERELRQWDCPNSIARKRHAAIKKKPDKMLKLIEESTRLTAKDFEIRVGEVGR